FIQYEVRYSKGQKCVMRGQPRITTIKLTITRFNQKVVYYAQRSEKSYSNVSTAPVCCPCYNSSHWTAGPPAVSMANCTAMVLRPAPCPVSVLPSQRAKVCIRTQSVASSSSDVSWSAPPKALVLRQYARFRTA